MNCGLVVVAAGTGSRLGMPQHKALVPVGGIPLILRCAELFSRIPVIASFVLVVHRDDRPLFEGGSLAHELARLGAWKVVEGGPRRQDSVLLGLQALSKDIDGALVHDAARPFVDPEVVLELIAALEDHVGAVPVVPVTSTVKRVDAMGHVRETVERADLRLAQTPQAGRRVELIEALERARDRGLDVTDDVAALEDAGHRVVAVPDSPWNFKITTPEDLALAEIVAREELWLKKRS